MNEMLKYAYDFTLSEQIVEQAEENRPYDADNEILYSNLYNKINYERVEFLIKRGSQSVFVGADSDLISYSITRFPLFSCPKCCTSCPLLRKLPPVMVVVPAWKIPEAEHS